MAFEIIYAKDARDHSELETFIAELGKRKEKSKDDRILYNQIFLHIQVLEDAGTRNGESQVKHLQGDIWELRPRNVRILFSVEGSKVVLLNYFFKKTPKAPPREIAKAHRLLKRWRDNNVDSE